MSLRCIMYDPKGNEMLGHRVKDPVFDEIHAKNIRISMKQYRIPGESEIYVLPNGFREVITIT